jgi:predicted nucleic acid-binding protein
MGSLSDLRGKSVDLDVNAFIYFLEDYAPLSSLISSIFQEIEVGRMVGVTSELSLAELLVKPLRDGKLDAAARYQELLTDGEQLRVMPVSRDVLIAAARVRAAQGIKLPDAIHLATAEHFHCATFLTNDRRLGFFQSVPVTILSEMKVEP